MKVKLFNFKKKYMVAHIIIMLSALLIACTNDSVNTETTSDSNDNAEIEQKTVTIAGPSEADFEEFYKEPIEAELPHITLEYGGGGATIHQENLEEAIVAQAVPDLIHFSGQEWIESPKEMELHYDLHELIDKHNFDLSRIEPSLLSIAESYEDGNDELYALPLNRRTHNLYYNKQIFDLFGASYPEDEMTYTEVIELAREVTGEQDGMLYHGFDINSPNSMLGQRSAIEVDPDTDKPRYTTDPLFQDYFYLLQQLWTIPGMLPENADAGDYIWTWGGNFFFEENVAMSLAWDNQGHLANEAETGLDLDVVSWPVWEDQPGIGPIGSAHFIVMTNTTEHKDEAFEVLEYIYSDEYQRWRSAEGGQATALADQEIQESFLTEHEEAEHLSTKNIDSAFILEPSEGLSSDERSDYMFEYHLGDEHNEGTIEIYNELSRGIDVNTLLMQFQEQAEIAIEEEKSRE